MEKCGSGRIRDALLRVLEDSAEHTLPSIALALSAEGLDEADVKAALFRLSAEGQVEITPGWTFRLCTASAIRK